MIDGAHAIVYSRSAEADRVFLRDVLGLPWVDAGDGWLIFGLPPSEVAVHPGPENCVHELYFMCEDVKAFVAGMEKRGVACGAVADRGWGLLTEVTLPGGGKIDVYEPRHARPKAMRTASAAPAARKPERPVRKPARPVRKKEARSRAPGARRAASRKRG